MASRSQCSHCAAALGSEAKYCSECGTPQTLIVFDPLGVEDPPLIRGTGMAPHARLTMLAGLLLVFAMLAVLWGLSRDADPADEESLSPETPEEGVGGIDATTSTTVVTTTGTTTTGGPTATSEGVFVNGVAGPVLDDGVDGVLVRIGDSTMQRLDLSTGAVERIDLEHPVYSDGPESSIIVNGKLIAARRLSMTITDLSDGSQLQPRDIYEQADSGSDGPFEGHVAGRAGSDSVWLATYPEPDQTSEAIEVGLDGEVRRRVEIPQPFEIRWADGDELILDSPDGTWRYDTETGATVRMPGQVLAFEPGLAMTTSCGESLQCDVLLDRGNGPEVVDWLSASDEFDSPIDLSPDLSWALVHVDVNEPQGPYVGAVSTFIDLQTGSRVDLGYSPIDPYADVVWVEGSRWIIAQVESSNRTLAIDTEIGTQVELELGSPVTFQSFLAFIPSN